ncbi:CBS domain containing protein [Solidesulfovibrio fructosivorans JJ]]|uniref:CBS domain containing protein n=1 Tax=Solidesulfovibrio fructosivorans JJ] TaxID=596151 RepID=E1JWS2_SOLFR|nr:CBS domain-containing protein [Solidesulfovibrio fructosivorans]EFL51126.1 CBS domain containing protein [Solidesulfovibrio fructosivorans JJ]]
MRIRNMMHKSLAVIGPDVDFAALLAAYRQMESRLVYVVDKDGKLLGVISSYDILRVMFPFYLDSNLVKALPDDESVLRQAFSACKGQPAADIMTTDFAAVTPDALFLEAEALIAERGVNVLPVIDDEGRLVGEVSRRAILKYLAERCGLEDEA